MISIDCFFTNTLSVSTFNCRAISPERQKYFSDLYARYEQLENTHNAQAKIDLTALIEYLWERWFPIYLSMCETIVIFSTHVDWHSNQPNIALYLKNKFQFSGEVMDMRDASFHHFENILQFIFQGFNKNSIGVVIPCAYLSCEKKSVLSAGFTFRQGM